jgi:hypothetical protein
MPMARHAARTLPSSAAIANTRRRNRYSRSSCVTATRPFSSTWSSRRRMRRRSASVGDVPQCRYISETGQTRRHSLPPHHAAERNRIASIVHSDFGLIEDWHSSAPSRVVQSRRLCRPHLRFPSCAAEGPLHCPRLLAPRYTTAHRRTPARVRWWESQTALGEGRRVVASRESFRRMSHR